MKVQAVMMVLLPAVLTGCMRLGPSLVRKDGFD